MGMTKHVNVWMKKWTCLKWQLLAKIKVSIPIQIVRMNHRKEAKVIDLTYECLEKMDNLILQSTKGVHVLFEKHDIISALRDGACRKDEDDFEKLKKIQDVLYKFISLKEYSDKQKYLKSLQPDEYSLLIRAYFKIVENSMLNKSRDRH